MMKQRFLWLKLAMLVGILSVGITLSQQYAFADDEGGTATKEKPSAEKEEAEEEKETDPFEIPKDASPKELLKYIDGLRRTRPEEQTREAFMAHIGKIVDTSIEAAGRIIASKDATDEEVSQAVAIKFEGIGMLQRLGRKNAKQDREDFMKSLKEDKRPAIQAIVERFALIERAGKLPTAEKEEQEAFISDFVAYLGKAEISREHVGLVSQIGRMLEHTNPELAAEFYNKITPVFSKSEDKRIASMAKRFEGISRRLGLIGNPMEIKGKLLDGTDFDMSKYKGKVVLVDFWATWCGPCRAEIPNVKKAYEQYNKKGFDVVGISLDTDKEKVENYMESKEIPWVTLYSDDEETNGWNHPMAKYYGISGIPATILIGKDGNVISLSARGPSLWKQLKEELGEPIVPEEANEANGNDDDKDADDKTDSDE